VRVDVAAAGSPPPSDGEVVGEATLGIPAEAFGQDLVERDGDDQLTAV
jgi:hypothetical protein